MTHDTYCMRHVESFPFVSQDIHMVMPRCGLMMTSPSRLYTFVGIHYVSLSPYLNLQQIFRTDMKTSPFLVSAAACSTM